MRCSDWSSDVCSSDFRCDPRAERKERKADRAAGHAWVSDVEVSGDHRVGIGGVAVTASSFVTLGSLRLSSRPSDRREREPGSMGGPGACSLSSAPCSGPRQSTTRRSEEHTSELQSLMRTSYDVFCLKKNRTSTTKK